MQQRRAAAENPKRIAREARREKMVSRIPVKAISFAAAVVTIALLAGVFIVYYLRGNWLKRRIAAMGYAPEVKPAKAG